MVGANMRAHCAQNLGTEYANSLPLLGEAMADILTLFGCKIVFGVGGDFADNIISAFEGKLETAPSSNEMHAGYAACAQAQISGLGATLTTFTVGSLPCSSPAALAVAEKLPVVFISGAPGEQEISDTLLHHSVASSSEWMMKYDCALKSFRALGMRAERLQGARSKGQPNMAAERFFQLVAHAYANKQPVFIEIPRDLVFEPTQALKLPQTPGDVNHETYVLDGAQHIAEHIVEKLNQSSHPLLFVGENVKLNTRLCEQLRNFVNKFNIPYATSWLAKGVLDESDPLSVGSYNGVFSPDHVRYYIEQKVDYILEVDTSIQSQDTNNAFCSGTHVIQSFENKTMVKGTVQNQQGLLHVFEQLLVSDIPVFQTLLEEKRRPVLDDNDSVDFHNLADALNDVQSQLSASLIYLPEIGNSYFASYSLETKRSSHCRPWLTNPWYGAMGSSLPYARAVAKTLKSSNSSDIAVVITGDGGFHFQSNELIHFQREHLAVVILYMRNNIFHLGKSGESTMYHCSSPGFDVLTLVNAYGGRGFQCKTVGELRTQLKSAVESNCGITLLEIPVDPNSDKLSREISMLNLFIQMKNGKQGAIEAWDLAVAG